MKRSKPIADKLPPGQPVIPQLEAVPAGLPPIGSWAAWYIKDVLYWYLTLPNTAPSPPPPPEPPPPFVGMTRRECCDWLSSVLLAGMPQGPMV